MAEPTTALKVSDLVKQVAEFIGTAFYGTAGTSKALLPVDKHNLDQCNRIVKEAIDEFMLNAPPEGWRWQRRIMPIRFKTGTQSTATSGSATTLLDSGLDGTYADDYYNDCIIEIISGTGRGETALVTDYAGTTAQFTFAGGLSGGSTPDDTSEYLVGHRYKLADDFGGTADGPIVYAPDSNRGHLIDWVDESVIRTDYEVSLNTGYPRRAAIRAYGRRQWEIIFFPFPTETDTVEFPYTAFFDEIEIASGIATSTDLATTLIDTTNRNEADDFFNGQTLTILEGTGSGQTATITDFDLGTNKLTFSAGLSGSSTPDTTSIYMLEPAVRLHPAGFQFDPVIRMACFAQAEASVEDVAAGWTERYF